MLTKYSGSGGNVVIPDDIDKIGEKAFLHCDSLINVTLPNSVTSIAAMCVFKNCIGLTDVRMTDNVTQNGFRWFCGCSNLKSINIPKSATEIMDYAFYNCAS